MESPMDHEFSNYQVSIMQSCDQCTSYIWAMEKAYMCSGKFEHQNITCCNMKYSWMIILMFICQFSELKSFPRRSLWDSLKIKSTTNWSWSSTDIWLRYCLCENIFGFKNVFSFQLGQHEHDYLGICKHYRSVQDTDSVREVNWRMIGKLWEKKLVPWL